jgi:hypothetical protein
VHKACSAGCLGAGVVIVPARGGGGGGLVVLGGMAFVVTWGRSSTFRLLWRLSGTLLSLVSQVTLSATGAIGDGISCSLGADRASACRDRTASCLWWRWLVDDDH